MSITAQYGVSLTASMISCSCLRCSELYFIATRPV